MPLLRSAAHDLRHALTALRRAPAFTAGVVLTLTGGIGLSTALLAAARAGMRWTPPAAAPDFARGPGAAAGWTEQLRTAALLEHDGLRSVLGVMAAAALLVLAGTCVNVAALALARASARRHTSVMRAVLGAGPRRLVGEALAEAGVLAAAGAAGGVLLGAVAFAALRRTWPGAEAAWLAGTPDPAVVALGVGLPLAVVLLSTVLPVLAAARGSLYAALSTGGRATPGRHEGWVRRVVTVGQFAGSMMLMVGAGLLIRGSAPDPRADGPGFDPSDTLTLRLQPPAATRSDAAGRAAFFAAAVARAQAVPGVRSVSLATPGAWLGVGPRDDVTSFCLECSEGGLSTPVLHRLARHHAVGAGYFRALGVPLVDGREMGGGGAREVMVNRAAAARMFPGANPLGKTVVPVVVGGDRFVVTGGGGERYTVVGVAGDVQPPGLGSPSGAVPTIYFPADRHPPAAAALAIRTAGDPLALRPAVEAALLARAPGARVADVMTMEERLAAYRSPLRWFAVLLGVVGTLAVLLCSAGVYGVVAFGVARRTREIGVRMALGAQPRRVVAYVVGGGMRLARTGTIIGVLAALGLARALQQFFRGVRPGDLSTYVAVAALLAAVALVASYLPARRAARVDPMVALRAE